MDDYKEVDGDWVEESNLVFSDTLDEWLFTNDSVQVETIDGGSDWMPEGSAVWSDSLGKHIIQDDAQENSKGDWVYEDEDEDEDEQLKLEL
jgi:hypothetical protein